jgi:hypothetical protein
MLFLQVQWLQKKKPCQKAHHERGRCDDGCRVEKGLDQVCGQHYSGFNTNQANQDGDQGICQAVQGGHTAVLGFGHSVFTSGRSGQEGIVRFARYNVIRVSSACPRAYPQCTELTPSFGVPWQLNGVLQTCGGVNWKVTGSEVKQSSVMAIQFLLKLFDDSYNPDANRFLDLLCQINAPYVCIRLRGLGPRFIYASV